MWWKVPAAAAARNIYVRRHHIQGRPKPESSCSLPWCHSALPVDHNGCKLERTAAIIWKNVPIKNPLVFSDDLVYMLYDRRLALVLQCCVPFLPFSGATPWRLHCWSLEFTPSPASEIFPVFGGATVSCFLPPLWQAHPSPGLCRSELLKAQLGPLLPPPLPLLKKKKTQNTHERFILAARRIRFVVMPEGKGRAGNFHKLCPHTKQFTDSLAHTLFSWEQVAAHLLRHSSASQALQQLAFGSSPASLDM